MDFTSCTGQLSARCAVVEAKLHTHQDAQQPYISPL